MPSATYKGWFNDIANGELEARYNNTAFLLGTATTLTLPLDKHHRGPHDQHSGPYGDSGRH